jgi:hypothetical protein
MTRWSDVIVGDYNYWFDGGAMLYGMAQAHDWRVSVLADEGAQPGCAPAACTARN